MKDLLFVLLFLPFLYFAYKKPFLGLCGWLWTIMIVPANFLWGFAAGWRYTYMLAIATLLGVLINKDTLRKPAINLYSVLMILLVIQTGISNIFTLAPPDISWQVWIDFFKAILFALLCFALLTTKNRIHIFITSLLLGVGFNIFFEGMKYLVTLGNYPIEGIKNSMMSDNNLFALATLMTLPFLLYGAKQAKEKTLRLVYMGFAGLASVCVIGSFSRGGFVGLLIVGWRVFLKSKYKIIFLVISLSFLSGALYIASTKWVERIQTIEKADKDDSFMGRVTAWKLSTLAALDRPLIGVGQDAMQQGKNWAHYYENIGMFDFISTKNSPADFPKATHSIYFQVLGDAGFIGFFLFVALLLMSLWKSWQLSKNAQTMWIRDLAGAINIFFMVFMVSGALLSLAYYDLIYAVMALLICIERIDQETLSSQHKKNNEPSTVLEPVIVKTSVSNTLFSDNKKIMNKFLN